METNFDKVIEFNKTFGVDISDNVQQEIFTMKPELVKLRYDLIKEEVDELKEAIDNDDMVETIDALADILYVVYGAGASFGINLNKAFDMVHKSNMSKLCNTEEEAIETVMWYKHEYVEGNKPYDTPKWKLSDDNKYYIVFNESSGKILKSINYQPVNFSNFKSNENIDNI